MVLIVLYGFLLAGLSSICASPVDRIVGGSVANIEQYPHHVSLQLAENHICSGSIIGSKWILTAAHCVEILLIVQVLKAIVLVGTNNLQSGGQKHSIEQVIVHDEFDPYIVKNDIALLKLSKNVNISDIVKIVPFDSVPPPDYSACQLSGWGYTSNDWAESPSLNPLPLLQQISLTIMPLDQCELRLRVYDTNLCTSGNVGQGTCHGDSGGALISSGRQVGVASFGIPCGKGEPDAYTSVAAYTDWIEEYSGISEAAATISDKKFLVSLFISLCVLRHSYVFN
ncbi:hypothetical protein FQR65_LT12987 [Abscondita terminalis]|nr:hypothetical protein FQR65_LT12987 [Abscondita terminalis]